ncbi:MAG: hypothetical protein U5O39_09255 [Gammaproteobacteria bacterium]|nr:hypothetical protein [Gammaproteobacteria bacterium]
MTRRKLEKILGDVRSVRDFQQIVESYVRRIIDRSMTSFENVGIDRLEPPTGLRVLHQQPSRYRR